MDYKDFQNAITGSANVQAPTTDPALASLFGSTFQLAQSQRGAQGLGQAAGMQAQYDANAAEQARQAKAQELKDKITAIKDAQDPKNYQKVMKEDGGFDFYDPTGKKIDVHQFAQVQGKPVKDILKDSQNNIDMQYVQDYEQMQKIANAYANNDKDKLDEIATRSGDPEFFKGKTAADIMKVFKQGYPQIYGMQGQNQKVRRADEAPAFVGGTGQPPEEEQQSFLQQLLGMFNQGQ